MTADTFDEHRRQLQEKFNSNKFFPLTKRQVERFHNAALDTSDLFERFVGLVLPYTGMRNGEFCHMRSDWVNEVDPISGDLSIEIEIPTADVCTGGNGPRKEPELDGLDPFDKGAVCAQCRADGRTHWEPKTENGIRTIRVEEEDAAEVITWWFKQQDEVPRLHNAVNRRIENIAERADIERKVTAHDLRDTYATMLVRKEFHPNVIVTLMGHNDWERLADYFDFVGQHVEQEFRKW